MVEEKVEEEEEGKEEGRRGAAAEFAGGGGRGNRWKRRAWREEETNGTDTDTRKERVTFYLEILGTAEFRMHLILDP